MGQEEGCASEGLDWMSRKVLHCKRAPALEQASQGHGGITSPWNFFKKCIDEVLGDMVNDGPGSVDLMVGLEILEVFSSLCKDVIL